MFRVKVLVPGLLLGLAMLLLAACGGGAAPTPTATSTPTSAPTPTTDTSVPDTPSAGGGKALFTGGSCSGCHTIEGLTAGKVGPDLTHIGTDAASRKPGTDASSYIFESIRDPEAFVADGVERAIRGVMTKGVTAGLSDTDIEQLTNFLLEQK